MTHSSTPDGPTAPTTFDEKIGAFFRSFTDLFRLPIAFWIVLFTFAIESMAYFGVLTLMATYLSSVLKWGDKWAGLTVSFFTGSVTLFMLGAGSWAERFGIRRAILGALALCVLGRVLYCLPSSGGGGVGIVAIVLLSLVIVAVGEAILQPVAYSGIKQYTDEKTSSMGYGLIYAVMNAMIFVIGFLSAWIRPAVDRVLTQRASGGSGEGGLIGLLADRAGSGMAAVNWVCTAVTIAVLIGFALLLTRKAEHQKLRPDRAEQLAAADQRPLGERVAAYFTEGPFANPRFLFFIFMLLPVRTLFAHQWLTMPTYILRAYSQDVADHMEWLVNWINPGVIFFGVPILTAMTRKVNVYTLMIVGSLVSAAPTFLLCLPPSAGWLITYMVVFSIGEALWSARFLEYASELAPEGRIAQYMGLAQIPWLLAKTTTGFYSGAMLNAYCPAGVPKNLLHTESMWMIYGCIAMISPIGLMIARKWVMAGLDAHKKSVLTTGFPVEIVEPKQG